MSIHRARKALRLSQTQLAAKLNKLVPPTERLDQHAVSRLENRRLLLTPELEKALWQVLGGAPKGLGLGTYPRSGRLRPRGVRRRARLDSFSSPTSGPREPTLVAKRPSTRRDVVRYLPPRLDITQIVQPLLGLARRMVCTPSREHGAILQKLNGRFRTRAETSGGADSVDLPFGSKADVGTVHTHRPYPDGEPVPFSPSDFESAYTGVEFLSLIISGGFVLGLLRGHPGEADWILVDAIQPTYWRAYGDRFQESMSVQAALRAANLAVCSLLGFGLYIGRLGDPTLTRAWPR